MRGLDERCNGAAIAFALVAGAERLGGEGLGLPVMVSVLIDSDMVNTTLTREPYDMIDIDNLVSREDVKVRKGS